MPRHGSCNAAGGLRFFLPGRLVEFEYFSTEDTEEDDEYRELAKSYHKDMDFAFFAVNFGYSKEEYGALTWREKAFIYKAWEDKIVRDSYNLYNAVFTAEYNANRPKRKKALKLWKKRSIRKANMETIENNLNIIREIEAEESHDWIHAVYAANGMEGWKGGVA